MGAIFPPYVQCYYSMYNISCFVLPAGWVDRTHWITSACTVTQGNQNRSYLPTGIMSRVASLISMAMAVYMSKSRIIIVGVPGIQCL